MSLSVVIIDDEKWTREVIRRFVPWEEMQLTLTGEASDGAYGLELVDQLSPDIILTDVKMPRMSGIELIAKLRERKQDTCVIVISGYDDYAYIRDAMRYDSVDYLLKPVKQEELREALSRCLARIGRRKSAAPVLQSGITLDHVYYALREEVSICLKAGNAPLLQKRLQALAQHLDQPALNQRGNLVAVYCGLMEEMQKTRLDAGLPASQTQPYVFSDSATAQDMLSHIGRQLEQTLLEVSEIGEARGSVSMDEVKKYMDANWQKGVTLDSVASHFGLSRNHLSKAFRAAEPIGFSDYLIRLRMEHARRLILDYRLPLKDVGAQVGYADQANFYKRFRAYFGMTPGEMLAKDDNERQPN